MEDLTKLFSAFSIGEILTFIVVLALAVKGVITFVDWVIVRLRKAFDKEYKNASDKEKILQRLQQHDEILEQQSRNQAEIINQNQDLANKITMLIASDRDDIKSFLTKQHHYFCYQQKWIDDYSLECCEKRYGHYKEEGGNSFIEGFMKDLRRLPKVPPSGDPLLNVFDNR